ncbi:MAG TPA: hypothetical protein VH619_13145 [Verrucomicrobiae bacterium]|nr:hypothetical protein [Verrucomicrobiae bacterium]
MRRIERRHAAWVAIGAAALMFLVGCRPNETKTLLEPSQALGPVIAEEAIRAADANKKIAVITHDDSWGPPSTVEQAFTAAVEKQGFTVFTAKAAFLGDPMHMKGLGLQANDFFEAVQNAAGAGAIVSFAGAPLVTPDDAGQLPTNHPPILVVATRNLGAELGVPAPPDRLESLLQAGIIQLAIINGPSDSDSATPPKADAIHQLFAQNYTILRQPQ